MLNIYALLTVSMNEKRTDPRKPPKSVRGWEDTSKCLYICIPEKTKSANMDAIAKDWLLEIAGWKNKQ